MKFHLASETSQDFVTQYFDILFDIEYPKEAMATNSNYQLKRQWLLTVTGNSN